MPAPIRFLHLTDLHISDPAVPDPELSTDTLAALDEAIARIAAMDPAPAFVVISGDLTNRGDAESYRLLAGRLSRIAVPIFLAMGNHDDRAAFHAELLGQPGNARYAHDGLAGGAHVIVLDSQQPGRIGGRLEEDQFAFLEAALARHPDVPKIVVCHHPPAHSAEEELIWHSLDWESTARLGAALQGRAAGLLCGHVHVPRVSHWHGLPVVVGNGLHNLIDPMVLDGMRILETVGITLCTLRPSGLTAEFVTFPHRDRELAHLPMEVVRGFV
jgi:3',5'-cyclic AMP phosphodiesterase CpdA